MSQQTYSMSYDKLVAAGNLAIETGAETIAAGQKLVRGTLLGRVDTDGTMKMVNKTAADGSQTLYAILAQDIDTTTAANVAAVFYVGNFNTDAMTVPAGEKAVDYKAQGRKIGLIFRTVTAVPVA